MRGFTSTPQYITPDDLDDVILGKVIKETGIWYWRELKRQTICNHPLAG
jgi:hypothetical protein